MSGHITQSTILNAYDLIKEHVRRTPILRVPAGELVDDVSITLKLEQMQHSGSFKARGGFNALLSGGVPATGVIAASGGNHGAAVAYAANKLGVRAEIFVPEIVSPAKLAKLEQYGARINVIGANFSEALVACLERQKETGAKLLHAYDQQEIVAGQGTAGLEFEEQAPEIDSLLVAVGGGGLIGGLASWYRGKIKIIAVETEGTATLHSALNAGQPVSVSVSGLAADALGASLIGDYGFDAGQNFVHQSVLVTDADVKAAQDCLWNNYRQIAEPGGATALAALLSGVYAPDKNEKVGVLICGGNASLSGF
ncbi:threonine dehydratase [Kiloniella spongiae]|uniref:Threonine dehydratase n=1 Tax=Kiloniella spongiae TaxID=1489064 RepID=A0A0H2MDZ5_9PROT|nr:threonine/serine dehydratase [Kiloniella spongiae]KLN60411.1 threonine dehydratase [Kiloniella spongiae]